MTVTNDKIECLLCNKLYQRLGTHMRTHSISLDTYKKRFLPYLFEGKKRTYIIDFYIVNILGDEYHVEIKPNKFSPGLKTETKWETAKTALPNFTVINYPTDLLEFN